MALAPNRSNNPCYLKTIVTINIKRVFVKKLHHCKQQRAETGLRTSPVSAPPIPCRISSKGPSAPSMPRSGSRSSSHSLNTRNNAPSCFFSCRFHLHKCLQRKGRRCKGPHSRFKSSRSSSMYRTFSSSDFATVNRSMVKSRSAAACSTQALKSSRVMLPFMTRA